MKLPGSHREAVDPASPRLFLGPPMLTYIPTCLTNGFKISGWVLILEKVLVKVLPKLGSSGVPGEESGSCEVFLFPRLVDIIHKNIGNSIELMNRNGTHTHTDVATLIGLKVPPVAVLIPCIKHHKSWVPARMI